jgi:threonine dehydrogenase-like Zn-dependent dehydrogenase
MAVLGCGEVGQAAIETGDELGARVIALDVNDEKLALAKTLVPMVQLRLRLSGLDSREDQMIIIWYAIITYHR